MKILSLFGGIGLFLAGCNTTPFVIPDNHPANPSTSVGRENIATAQLQPDADTLRTAALLKERENETGRTTMPTGQ